MKKIHLLFILMVTTAHARLAPVRGDFDWKKLVGNYKLVLSTCSNTTDSSERPSQSFTPISEKLKISLVDAPVEALNQKGAEQNEVGDVKGLLIEAQIDGVMSSAIVTRIGAKAYEKVISTAFLEQKECDVVTRRTEAFPTNLGIYAHVTHSHPACYNQNEMVRLTDDVQVSLAEDPIFGDKLFLVVSRDSGSEKRLGFECRFKRVP